MNLTHRRLGNEVLARVKVVVALRIVHERVHERGKGRHVHPVLDEAIPSRLLPQHVERVVAVETIAIVAVARWAVSVYRL